MSATFRRRRLVAAAVVLGVLVAGALGAAVAVRAIGGDGPPATGAARLAPRDTLVWVHVSTDGDRDAVERARELLGRFTAYDRARQAILEQLAGTDDVRPGDVAAWLGDEAAIALVEAGGTTAGSLVVAAVEDEDAAREFLEAHPGRTAVREYKDERIDEYGAVAAALKDGYLLIGQDRTVRGALDRANGRGDTLLEDPTFRRASAGMPDGRVASAYVSAGGLRRLLAPQGGVFGVLATLLDQPGLRGIGLSLEAGDDLVRVRTRSVLDPAVRGGAPEAFEPRLADDVPADALAYLSLGGASTRLANLLAAAAGGADAGGAGPVLERLRKELGPELGRELLRLLDGEVAIAMRAGVPVPTLVLMTEVDDEERAADVLRRAERPLARALGRDGAGAGLSHAVFDGRLVLATAPDGIRWIRDADEALADSEAFREVTDSRPEMVGSLGLLDFSQLLEIGEQTGLDDDRAYLAARDDLRRIRAVGVSSYGTEGETTAEILLSIP